MLHVDPVSQISSVSAGKDACIAPFGSSSPCNELAGCVCAERQHAKQAGGNGGGCAQAAAARLQEGHAEAAAGTCLAHLCIQQCMRCALHQHFFLLFVSSFSQ